MIKKDDSKPKNIVNNEEKQNNRCRENKGITLVALVITIIIIIILATVTINMAFGDNGLITQAQLARDMVANSTVAEQEGMNCLMDEYANLLAEDSEVPVGPTTPTTVAEAKEEGTKFTETTPLKDDLGNIVYIPGGFHVDKEDSGTKVEDGIVIEDNTENQNQFVWIPTGEYNVAEDTEKITEPDEQDGKLINELTRRQWGTEADVEQVPTPITGDEVAAGYDGYQYYYGEGATQDKDGNPITSTETNIEAFKTSATTNGGFYIGRYEQGTGNVCKAGVDAYVSVTRDIAKTQAEAMYSGNSEIKVTTELISSYAWDTALNFICQTNTAGYTLATTIDEAYANIGTSNKTQTGEYEVDNYSKIHDLLGNCQEWTTEYSSNSASDYTYPCVTRGGYYYNSSFYAASRRSNTTGSSNYVGFRAQLYL